MVFVVVGNRGKSLNFYKYLKAVRGRNIYIHHDHIYYFRLNYRIQGHFGRPIPRKWLVGSSVDFKVSLKWLAGSSVNLKVTLQWLVGSSVKRTTFEGQISLSSGSSARQSRGPPFKAKYLSRVARRLVSRFQGLSQVALRLVS